MAAKNQFKIFAELNDQKYSVLVESEYMLITFRKVCNAINAIISQTKQNVSFKTHVFEVSIDSIVFFSSNLFAFLQLFDRDFEEYVIITDEYHLVDNISTIKIKMSGKSHDNCVVI